jgi:hypothetical protein
MSAVDTDLIIARLAAAHPGEGAQTLYGQYVKQCSLKPEIDAAEFRKRLAAARGESLPVKARAKVRHRPTALLKPCLAYACVRETEGSRWIDIGTIASLRETAKARGEDFNARVPTYVGSDGCNRIVNVVKVCITIEAE